MAYSRRNSVEDQREASQRAKQITATCEELSIQLDPIDWQHFGMRATVKVNGIEIGSLLDLGHRESNDILRAVQIKLLEQTALEVTHSQPGVKALMWTPVEVTQPQEFLSLWIITLENDERVPISESIKNGKRVYERYKLAGDDEQQLSLLFGPASKGEYQTSEMITIKERDRQFTGKIIYVIPPGKPSTSRKGISRGYHTIAGTTYTNDVAARYIVDCNDGFPHIVNQSQVVR
jgi:hypothetical protein